MRSVHAPGPTPARIGLGRPAVLISLGLHVLFFVVTLGVPRLLASSPKSTPVYVVDLVSLGSGGPSGSPPPPPAAASKAPAAAPAPPKPAPTPPKPKKAPEKAIVIPERTAKKTPPKETKKPPVKPEPKAEPAAVEEDGDEPQTAETPGQDTSLKPAAATSAPAGGAPAGAPGGVPGSTGSGAGQGDGVGGDAYNFYLALLDRSIKGAWKRPLYGGKEILSATVRLEISRSGRVVKLELITPSGNEALDRSVLKAVRDAEPFPPLPTPLTLSVLQVQIVFELNPDASGPGTGG